MHQHLHPTRPSGLPEVADHIIEEFVERNAIPGASIAITTPDGSVFAGAHGHRDLATGAAATADTSYLWFSLTKVVTATAVRILADEGRVDLDVPAADLVPALRDSGRGDDPGPTVRQLVTHTAGFANPLPIRWVTADAAHGVSADDLLERLLAKHGSPTSSIGGRARYSNLGYLVLGAVIEAAAGEPFTGYVERAVLEPLGMERTGFRHVRPDLAATGYVKVPRPVTPFLRAVLPHGIVGPRVQGRSALHPFTVLGPSYGGLVGPATDAARFAAMHLGDGELDGVRILRPETAVDMRRISAFGRRRDFGNAWFASAEHRTTATRYVEHLGAGGGFYNAMRIYPDRGVGIVVMTNTTKAYDHHELFSRLLEVGWAASSSPDVAFK
jgi:CubicO group peptidase (beta-lactamase class C family)